MIKTNCRYCGTKISFSEADLGMIVQCPNCNQTFKAEFPASFSAQSCRRRFLDKYVFGKFYYFFAFFVAFCILSGGGYIIYKSYKTYQEKLSGDNLQLSELQRQQIIEKQNNIEAEYSKAYFLLSSCRIKSDRVGFEISSSLSSPETFFNTDLSNVEEIQESIDELTKLKEKHKRIQTIFVSTLKRNLSSLKELLHKYRAAGINSVTVRRQTGLKRIERSGADLYVEEYRPSVKKYIRGQKDLIYGMKNFHLFVSESDVQNDMRRLANYLTYISDNFFLATNVKLFSDKDNATSSTNYDSANNRKEQEKKEKRDTIEAVIQYFESNIENLSSKWIVDEEIVNVPNFVMGRVV